MSSCVKCDDGVAVIMIGTNGTFCKDCFEKYFTHKFRASLGKHPIVRHGDRVAIAFSGGNNSSALLKLVTECLSPNAFKRMKFHPGIIFIDETSVIQVKDCETMIDKVESIMKESGLPYNIVKLEEVINIELSSEMSTEECSQKLFLLFDSLKTVTAKEELIYRLRCKLLAFKAHKLAYQHVFLGESSSRLAINILSNIAQGRGAHLPLDTRFTDQSRYRVVDLLRPMRDMTSKEIAVYNAIHNVKTVSFPTFSTKLSSTASIQRLTEDFVLGLSTNFPSTETTVYRTSNKLQISSENSKADNICLLCYGPIHNVSDAAHASALNALNFTECLSAGELGIPESPKFPENLLSEDLKAGAFIDQLVPSVPVGFPSSTDVLINLCHACKILHKDINKGSDFDQSNKVFHKLLKKANTKKLNEDEMKEKLEGLLLDS